MRRGIVALVCALLASACAVWNLREPLNVTIADLKPIEVACSSNGTP